MTHRGRAHVCVQMHQRQCNKHHFGENSADEEGRQPPVQTQASSVTSKSEMWANIAQGLGETRAGRQVCKGKSPLALTAMQHKGPLHKPVSSPSHSSPASVNVICVTKMEGLMFPCIPFDSTTCRGVLRHAIQKGQPVTYNL